MTFLTSPHCWLDSLATLPDSDVSDLCSEVHLVSREGDTISIPTVVLLATSNLLRQLICLNEEKQLIFPDVANVHLEQAVDLLTTGTCGTPGSLRRVGRDLQQVQYVMDLLGTGITVHLDNMKESHESQEMDQINNNFNNNNSQGGRSLDNNNLKSIEENSKDCKKGPKKKTKYNRRELKRLISAPKKSGRPLAFGLYCNLCGAGFPTSQSLRTHVVVKHPESTFVCRLCPQRFFNESSLQKHFVAKHSSKKSRKPPSPSIKPAADVEVVGETKNRAKCPLCSKFFATKYMKIHVDIVHKGLRYACGEEKCNFIGTTKTKARKHCSDVSHSCEKIKQVSVSPSKLREQWTLKRGN